MGQRANKFKEKKKNGKLIPTEGDEEVNKKYMFKQNAQYFGLKTDLFQGLKAI